MTLLTPPILLLAWRRPHTLRQVINAIRLVSPSRLYVACDGPNPDSPYDVEKVAATRAVIDSEIDWSCNVERLYSDVNLGCRIGVSKAITWFFDQVEEGIILEDDCVPHPDFFTYCTVLLQRYRHDSRVWCISGNNFQDGTWSGHGDYFFSQIPMCWGWATWRSRWATYDSDLNGWPVAQDLNLLFSLIPDASMRLYWSQIWQRLWFEDKPDSWAYRWAFTCVVNRGITAVPKANLVTNVGFGDDATHTFGVASVREVFGLPSNILKHPSFIVSNSINDLSIFNYHFKGRWRRFPFSVLRFTFIVIRRLVGRVISFLTSRFRPVKVG
ncbi:nucleotide-diphospho-sugar transferase [Synechococcus sp. PROS-9-1]|uniref:glycosyltransferase family 2 protein n=1 Tax=Synechococcus sp. PROS-9-1 TaxID=1968775 RepID=UPI001644DCA0|nr:glycosyltransferase family 2 protein [Synechococcus sp. PROS-9-1]QNJ30616.1 nucleotide-diphospho-sugar transferase [Synechococcus sp. PROS-9-1]